MKRTLSLLLAGLLATLGIALGAAAPALADGPAAPVGPAAPCVPAAAYTETTDWVLASPGAGWTQVDQRTVTDTPASTEDSGWVTAVPAGDGWVQVDTRVITVGTGVFDYQRYSWTGGPTTVAPAWNGPSDPNWQANTKGSDSNGDPVGVVFQTGAPGKGNWFYWDAVERTQDVTQFRYERTIPAVTHEEYKFSFDHPAVDCPPPTDVCPDVPGDQTDPADCTIVPDPDACSNIPGVQAPGFVCFTTQPADVVATASEVSYNCGDDFSTVVTLTSTTSYVTADQGYTWTLGEPVSTSETTTIPAEVVACPTPEPGDPTDPTPTDPTDPTDDGGVTQATPAVVTTPIASPTASALPATGGPSGPAGLLALVTVGVGGALVIGSRRFGRAAR